MTTLIIGVLCLVFGYIGGRIRQQQIENRGEAAVRRELLACFSSSAYHLLNNVTLPLGKR